MTQACPAKALTFFKLGFGLLMGLSLILNSGEGVFAQESTEAPTQSAQSVTQPEFGLNGLKTDFIWTKASLADEIVTQRKMYRDQLEVYRQQEKNFLIAQDQYRRHETLDAIEQAVKASRQVMLSRDQVLHTYLTLLQLKLMEAEGIEISLKNSLISRLDILREKLKIHHASAIDQFDRPTANRLSDDFLPIGEEAQLVGSQVLGLLSLGKLQEIYDKASVLSPDITAEVTVATEDKTVSAETTRSLRETAGSLIKTKASLDLVWQRVAERIESGSVVSGQTDFSQELNTSYVNLTKSLGYFLELLKLYRTAGAAAV